MTDSPASTADERWLATMWPFVHEQLPPSPGRILEIGCGPLGGFVPALRSHGYDAVGVDPQAPQGADYHRTEFERHRVTAPVDVIVACTSLHHVADLYEVVDLMADALTPGGVLVVVEWARERFDEATARWCFARLAADGEPGWLHRHRNRWSESGESWDSSFQAWAQAERLHTGQELERALRTRFDTRLLARRPYFFPALDGVTDADEQAAVDAGHIQATGIRYVGRLKAVTG
ncbi:class I SAM-dependent methyltransferase [Streptosporangium canum]|uniref:class I SAM-dependent methyltransferase n=1 Tax=Streptosporangium canum TaxID=324952 RepID=UPI003693D6D9